MMFRDRGLVAVPSFFGLITLNASLTRGSMTMFNITNSNVLRRVEATVLYTLLPNIIADLHT